MCQSLAHSVHPSVQVYHRTLVGVLGLDFTATGLDTSLHRTLQPTL